MRTTAAIMVTYFLGERHDAKNIKARLRMDFPHCIAFFITYLGLLISMDKKVITLKTQRNAENACGNRMWQLGFNNK